MGAMSAAAKTSGFHFGSANSGMAFHSGGLEASSVAPGLIAAAGSSAVGSSTNVSGPFGPTPKTGFSFGSNQPQHSLLSGDMETNLLPNKKASQRDNPNNLDEIIDLQGASGIFSWGPVLEKILKTSFKDFMANKDIGFTEELWLTAVVITLLEMKMPEKQDTWVLMVEKAKKCLKIQLNHDKYRITKIFDHAKNYIMHR